MEPIEPKPVESKKTPWARNVLLLVVLVGIAGFCLWPRPFVNFTSEYATETQNNLKQIALALQVYEHTHGSLPPATVTDAQGRPLYSWRAVILTEVGRPDLHQKFHWDKPWDSPENRPFIEQIPAIYRSPYQGRDLTDGLTAYQALVEEGDAETLFLPTRGRRMQDAADGPSKTAVVVEELHQPVIWTKPDDVTPGELLTGLNSENRPTEYASFITGDGAVHRVKGADRDELLPFMYANDGKVPGE